MLGEELAAGLDRALGGGTGVAEVFELPAAVQGVNVFGGHVGGRLAEEGGGDRADEADAGVAAGVAGSLGVILGREVVAVAEEPEPAAVTGGGPVQLTGVIQGDLVGRLAELLGVGEPRDELGLG